MAAAAVAWIFLAFRAHAAASVTAVAPEITTNNLFMQAWEFLVFSGQSIPIYSVLCVFASVFVFVAIFSEFYRGAKLRAKRQETSLLNGLWLLLQRNKRRYGGYIVISESLLST